MIALAQVTDNATSAQTRPDLRRITEDDPDYRELHAVTVARLQRSMRQYAREVQRGVPGADTRFINRHIALMRSAYEAAHHAGQKDYWPAVSTRSVQHRYVHPDSEQTNKRLTYYALGSVLKMAHEVKAYQRQQQTATLDETSEAIQLAAPTDVPPSFDNRVVLQGQIVWSGLQDGYAAAGASDSASPYASLYWLLGEAKNHCFDCPNLAFGSPYDPPWAGTGSNQLTQSPGDGQTECGAACKCSLSYDYPSGDALAPLGQAIQGKWNDWMPTGYDAYGDPIIQPVTPPGKGSTLTTPQKAALDEFRNSAQMWDTIRKNLPPVPSLFRVDDLPEATQGVMPAWETLTRQQQAAVTRIEQSIEQWMNAVNALVPPPVFLPDPLIAQRAWLEAAARGDFTPLWNDYQEPPSAADVNKAWFEWMATRAWPDPHLPDLHAEMDAWLNWAARSLAQQKAGTWIDTTYKASEPEEQPVIKLYNPNHDSKGRFTYGGGATTTVARGQGTTRRSAGGTRVKNSGVHAGLSKPGSTGAPSEKEAAKLLDFENSTEVNPGDEIARRLAGNADFAALAASEGWSPQGMTQSLIANWGMSAEAPASQAVAMAVQDEFGLKGTSPFRAAADREETAMAKQLYAAHGAGYRAFARAQYNATQDYLASKGISSLTLYRGSVYDEQPTRDGIKWGKSGTANISTRAISSFSTEYNMADGFASVWSESQYSLLISADVPASRIFSTYITGLGEDYQQEALILGGTDHWSYNANNNRGNT